MVVFKIWNLTVRWSLNLKLFKKLIETGSLKLDSVFFNSFRFKLMLMHFNQFYEHF
jgi:hypothetical protein